MTNSPKATVPATDRRLKRHRLGSCSRSEHVQLFVLTDLCPVRRDPLQALFHIRSPLFVIRLLHLMSAVGCLREM